ncbi:DUF4124 domain-containing protein [Luteimonas terricola]|uniref:DUF4124 domain-containing protein n=1 Tax=Luteimonas terricola TaxID=645597 RepID=A0ABQ2EG15_9GAMM|nr:DUF4124 domain-containing protein [Luteimonas terricola]GGK06961.1 hypothetical protein GCM10011394_15210 [Luteimonas terricola]
MDVRAIMILAAVIGVLAPGVTHAQTIFKCTDGKGGTAFQQTPCDEAARTESVRSFKPEPDTPQRYDQPHPAQAFQFQGDQDRDRSSARQQAPRRPDINPMSADAEMMRRMENLAGTREGRALLRQMTGQPSPRAAVPDPAAGIGLPTRVIDPRTSMPVDGAIKVAPNRIWDPKTGKYYWTTP